MKQKQRRNPKKKRKKRPKERKKTRRKEGRKKEGRERKKKRETEKEKVKKGEAKKGYGERKGDTAKINKNALFWGGKQCFSIKNKERKGTKKKKNKRQQKTNKEGLGPSEVALRATSPDP